MKELKRYMPAVIRISLGVIFIYASLLKIADPVTFAGSVAAYQILPYFANYVAAATLPFVEFVCGVLLVCGYRVKGAALIITGLNLVFMAALTSAIIRGLDIDCGCFKQGGEKTSPWVALGRDVIFLAMSLFVLKRDPKAGADIPTPASTPAQAPQQ